MKKAHKTANKWDLHKPFWEDVIANRPDATLVPDGTFFLSTDENPQILYKTQNGTWIIFLVQSNNIFDSNRIISNCVLDAPNGIVTVAGSLITAKSGLKILIPNGRNADGTLKNIEYTLPNDVSFTASAVRETIQHVGLNNGNLYLDYNDIAGYFEQPFAPQRSGRIIDWYNPITNLMQRSNDGGTTWYQRFVIPVARYTRGSTSISNFITLASPNLRNRFELFYDDPVVDFYPKTEAEKTIAAGTYWIQYASGRLEQGGNVANVTRTEVAVSFPKQFRNTQYTIFITRQYNWTADASNVWPRSTTYFGLQGGDNNASTHSWQAVGLALI